METTLALGLLALFGVLETLAGAYSRGEFRRDDWIINLPNLGHLAIIVRPAMVGIVAFLLGGLAPEFEGALASTPLSIAVLAVLLPDLWGRPWKLHRTHHTTPSMKVGVSYQENSLWFGEWSHGQGNYATLVFLYDVLFGTAALPHHPPTSIGIEDDSKDPCCVQLYWPFMKASDPSREFAAAPPRHPVSDS